MPVIVTMSGLSEPRTYDAWCRLHEGEAFTAQELAEVAEYFEHMERADAEERARHRGPPQWVLDGKCCPMWHEAAYTEHLCGRRRG